VKQEPEAGTVSPEAVPVLVEGLFRHESARILAALAHALGPPHLELAEDAVQEALMRALRSWPLAGAPQNPAAWLMRTARNVALDRLRRGQVARANAPELAALLSGAAKAPAADDLLEMLFMCCHPALPASAQLALTLRAAVGLSVAEIARTLLEPEPAVAQRLVRARRQIAEQALPLEMPGEEALRDRLGIVLKTIYLTFTAGHSACTGDQLVRAELCGEAIRLGGQLADHPSTAVPEVEALLALMCLTAGRLPARLDAEGLPLRLREPDRTRWDARLMSRGFRHLERAMSGDRLSSYHLEAQIASLHAVAPSFEETDWCAIVEVYERLHRMAPGPLVALNREVARSLADGPGAALGGLRRLERSLSGYYPYHLAMAEVLDGLGRPDAARASRRRALALAATEPVRAWIDASLKD
jgi:RNA polymerase sigma factor (sigma-70 family)